MRHRKKNNSQAGFTLLELLIVMAVIGLISSIAVGATTTTRSRTRDQRRIDDLLQIRKALELYLHDHGDYPPGPCGYNCNSYYLSTHSNWDTFANYLKPYIDRLPVDPVNNLAYPWNDGHYSYSYGNVGSPNHPGLAGGTPTPQPTYDLTGQLESPDHPQRCGVVGYRLYFTKARWCTAFGGNYSNQIYEASPD